jgi:hypothetical protein
MTIEATQTTEDLRARVERALDNGEPCWCGKPDEGPCPACGVAIDGRHAFNELMRRYEEAVTYDD